VLSTLVDGVEPLSVEWSLGRLSEDPLKGRGSIRFAPASAETYYLYVGAVGQDGILQQTIFQLQVVSGRSALFAPMVRWSTLQPQLRQAVTATVLPSTTGTLPSSFAWTVYLNSVPILSGTGRQATFQVNSPGVYRLRATVLDQGGASATADSSLAVAGGFELQSAVAPLQPSGTLYYLGSVYSVTVQGGAQMATALPYLVNSATSSVYVLPGTTHIVPEIESESVVQDDVVLRSVLGNWQLGAALTTESTGYGYGQVVTLPAPHDRVFRYTLDQWKVSDTAVTPFRFRIRFRCYRESERLYSYQACPYASFPGGDGLREQRMVALITSVDFRLDAERPDSRLGTTATASYTAPNAITLTGNFTPDGAPDKTIYHEEDHGFTGQNVIANYESTGKLTDLKAHAIYGIPGVRPAQLDFTQPGVPRIIQYAKRLHGKIVLYMAAGAVSQDTRITARVYTGKLPGYQDVEVVCQNNVYNGSTDEYVKIGEARIDITDFEFGRVGLAIDLTLDDSQASTNEAYLNVDDEPWMAENEALWLVADGTTTGTLPVPEVAPEHFYSTTLANAVSYQGACYHSPEFVDTFDGTFAASGSVLQDCTGTICGPRGVYCYTDGTNFAQVIQPLDHPAPYLAFVSDQAHCWHDPFFTAVTGTGTGAINEPYIPYSGTSGCGVGYVYTSCGSASPIAVLYPTLSSPHSYVAYGTGCFAFSGSVADLRPYDVVTVGDVTLVASCTDVACTGSNATGFSAWYLDQHGQRVNVRFPNNPDNRFPAFAVSRETSSDGHGMTRPGRVYYNSWAQELWPVYHAAEAATVDFSFSPVGITRRLRLVRGGNVVVHTLGLGDTKKTLDLLPGDFVYVYWPPRSRSVEGYVEFAKRVTLPVLYHTVILNTGTASAIQALGFCGFTSASDYTYYGNLPAETGASLPNPDSLVTVTASSGTEQVLVRTFAYGDRYYPLALPKYAGDVLAMPLTFKFYAARGRAGRHGEMDVWLDTDQPPPAHLAVSRYHSLLATSDQYRVTSQTGDINRHALRVINGAEAQSYVLPKVYAADTGQTLVAVGAGTEVYFEGQSFYAKGTDVGISTQIYTLSALASLTTAWLNAGGAPWTTTGTLPWTT
jgi:hypothetical protein